MHHSSPRSTRSSLLLLCLASLSACDSCGDDGQSGRFIPATTGSVGTGGAVTGASGFSFVDAGLTDVPVWEPRPGDLTDAGNSIEVVSVSPADGADDAPRDTTLEITLSRELREGSLPEVEIFEVGRSGFPIAEASVRLEGRRVIATLPLLLDPATHYRVQCRRSVVDRLTGESFGFSDLDWSFTTAKIAGALPLAGPLDAVAYDPVEERLWGFDREARTLAEIDLVEREEKPRTDLLYIPSDLCVSPDGQTVYVVNQGSSLVTEVAADSGRVLRQIPWPAPAEVDASLPYHIRCSEGRVLVVDAAERPGLWSFDVSQEPPVVTDHSATVSGLGDLASAPDGSALYAWWKHTEDERSQIAVGQLDPATFEPLQQTLIGPWFVRPEGLHSPVFLDPAGARVITHSRVFDAANVSIALFTFDTTVRAADFARERAVTDSDVVSLKDYRPHAIPLLSEAAHRFFDDEGRLHFIVHEPGFQLVTQTFESEAEPEDLSSLDAGTGEPGDADASDASLDAGTGESGDADALPDTSPPRPDGRVGASRHQPHFGMSTQSRPPPRCALRPHTRARSALPRKRRGPAPGRSRRTPALRRRAERPTKTCPRHPPLWRRCRAPARRLDSDAPGPRWRYAPPGLRQSARRRRGRRAAQGRAGGEGWGDQVGAGSEVAADASWSPPIPNPEGCPPWRTCWCRTRSRTTIRCRN